MDLEGMYRYARTAIQETHAVCSDEVKRIAIVLKLRVKRAKQIVEPRPSIANRMKCALALLVCPVAVLWSAQAFSAEPLKKSSISGARIRQHTTVHRMLPKHEEPDSESNSAASSRRNFFIQSTSVAAAATSSFSWFVDPAWAVSGASKVNAKLKGFGLPPVASIPDGFSPLLEVYGKGKNRSPLLVTFCHPLTWVVTLPSNTVNGEDGTIQAGDYGKGDTATLYVYTDQGNVGDITKQPKELIETVLKRSISLRGDNMYQNFKITKLTPSTSDPSSNKFLPGQSYMLADFKYQLLTGAGFEVDRKGVASITSEG